MIFMCDVFVEGLCLLAVS